jgi:hypothetical protein
MISQERKDQLKSEGEEGELQDKIRGYNKIFQRRKFIPLIATIYTFGMLLYYSGMLLYNSDMEPFSFPPEIIFTLLLFYLGFIVITRYFINRILMESSQPMAYYAAVSAAEQLDNDNLIEASFCADKLLEALSFLVKKKSIKVKSWKSSLKNLLYVQPRDIKNKAVHGAIQDSTATKNDFADQFYNLADSLSKAHLTSREFFAIGDFLEWLSRKSQNYESKIGFWARHQNYKILLDIMAKIAPIIVAILMLIG